MADGSVTGDVRELRQMLADCEQYLKDGETPAQRIERERRDTEAVLNLLIREKRKNERMREALQHIAQHFSSEWPERCQTNVLTARNALVSEAQRQQSAGAVGDRLDCEVGLDEAEGI